VTANKTLRQQLTKAEWAHVKDAGKITTVQGFKELRVRQAEFARDCQTQEMCSNFCAIRLQLELE
jgi:hypothetical protein